MKKGIFLALSVALFLGCSQTQPKPNAQSSSSEEPVAEYKGKERISLLEFEVKQDPSSLPQNLHNVNFGQDEILNRRFKVFTLRGVKFNPDDVFWAFRTYKPSEKKRYFGSNFRQIPDSWFEAQKENANFDALSNISAYAVTSANTALRNFPTDEPIFINPQNPGEGYPFDYLQISTLSIAHPLFVSHLSKDRAWAFVSDDAVWGWVKVEDIKFLSDEEASTYQRSSFITIKTDKMPVYDKGGNFLFYSRVGAILPVLAQDNKNYYGKIYVRNSLKEYILPKSESALFPLKFNDSNLKTLLSSLLTQPYGWGGVDKLRDCSLFTKDLLASFGVWLPRNSRAQANMGEKIDLKGLSNAAKTKEIKEKGVPYLTLVHLPGHIMLYAGYKGDDIYVVHDAWGIKTENNGRALIGATAITTLNIGQNRSDIQNANLLISKVDSINVIKPENFISDKARKISALERAYGVKVEENLVKFSDGTSLVYDDFKQKDEECSTGADIEDMNALDYAAFSPLSTALSDAGRCRNYELLGKIYGSSESAVKANLVDVIWIKDFLNLPLKFNSKNGAAAALQEVSNELNEMVKGDPNLLEYLKDPGGTFKWRVIAGTNRLSSHSYGIAVDINVKKSHYWQWSKSYENLIPEKIVRVFEKHKFVWGGRWKHFDTMHFEYRPEMFE